MDNPGMKTKLLSYIRKYRFAALVVMIGVLLMLLPGKNNQLTETTILEEEKLQTSVSEEERLESILSQVQGAGKVQVLLSVSCGEETIYQTDLDRSETADNSSERIQTVLVTDSERQERGLIRQVKPPEYKGAVVVCQGAEDPTVRYAIVEAVSKATGLGVHHITVLTMK